MSESIVEQLEKDDRYTKMELKLTIFVDEEHPMRVKKVCPYCGKVFDKFLLCAGPLIGCTSCAPAEALKRGIYIERDRIDKIVKEVANV